MEDVEPALSNADFDAAREKTSKGDTIVARLLGVGLARLGAVRRIDDIEKALRANLMEVIPHLEKRTHYLATFANLATLLGLLGTVSGLIHAFTAVATANPAEKANLLAASISEAMNCTAFGLMVAVPLLFVHSFLQSKTSQLIGSLETGAVKFLTIVADRQSAKAQTRLGRQAQLAQAARSRTPSIRCATRKELAIADQRTIVLRGRVAPARELTNRVRKPAEVMLVPMIDIFVVLVTFLLMTAVFSRITILQLDLPSATPAGAQRGAGSSAWK